MTKMSYYFTQKLLNMLDLLLELEDLQHLLSDLGEELQQWRHFQDFFHVARGIADPEFKELDS
jgi:hypothetical protein